MRVLTTYRIRLFLATPVIQMTGVMVAVTVGMKVATTRMVLACPISRMELLDTVLLTKLPLWLMVLKEIKLHVCPWEFTDHTLAKLESPMAGTPPTRVPFPTK